MVFTPTFLDELRERVSLAQVVGRRVRLQKRGREHSGLCPFHNEKTPSFTLNEDKGFFHCFGCGAHGDVIGFVMRGEGLSFPEAVARLASEAGLELPSVTPDDRARAERGTLLANALEAAAGWYATQLAGQVGRAAKAYLDKRGVKTETIARFRLGYAPGARTALKDAMLARGFAEAALVEAGLLKKPEDGGASYDRFRDRIMFPICDRRGRVIAFGGRAMAEGLAKYINSPETPLFHKGRHLYNLALAREAAATAGTVIVVEGYMDVIALAQAGIAHAVAPMGTALTEDQMTEAWRMAPEPVLCFDGDDAGWRAALRAAERALPLLKPGHSFRFALLPKGLDPDDLVRQKGAAAINEVVEQALPLSEILWRRAASGNKADTPERRAALRQDLFDLIRTVGDPGVRTYYRQDADLRLAKAFPGAARAAGGAARGRVPGAAGPLLTLPTARRERLLLQLALNHPALLDNDSEALAHLDFSGPDLDRLRRAILDQHAIHPGLDSAGLKHHLSEVGQSGLVERLVGPNVRYLEPFARPDASLAEAERGWQHILARHRRAGAAQEIRDAGEALARDWTEESLQRLRHLKAQHEAGHGAEAEQTE
jgi:DNA primase